MRAILQRGILPGADQETAAGILRACVHCGFCNATCPSYQVLGDERDGPRGRIYLMKSLLEGEATSSAIQRHLDRCLGCRACETTCPSGVQYSRLLELVRPAVERTASRPTFQRVVRWLLRKIVPYPARFGPLLAVGRLLRPMLPPALRTAIPRRARTTAGPSPSPRSQPTFISFDGCVQAAAAPQIDGAAARVMAACGVGVQRVSGGGCCGALSLHLGATEEAAGFARRNVDAWYPRLESGEVSGILSSSSGCTQVLKDYGHLLRDDAAYASRAQTVAAAIRDASEVVSADRIARAASAAATTAPHVRVAFQAPCSLQHGLRTSDGASAALRAAGYTLTPVAEAHLCCGSAGSYSILQPSVARALRERKLTNLAAGAPEIIATANIGCQLYLEQRAVQPVRHWLELVAERLG